MNKEAADFQRQKLNDLSRIVIGSCIDIHRELGPGLLEGAYEECLAFGLSRRGIRFERQLPMPVTYKTVRLDCGYRLDFLIEDDLIVELKSVTELLPIHVAQLMTQLKLSGIFLGLLINFNVVLLKMGIKRIVCGDLFTSTTR